MIAAVTQPEHLPWLGWFDKARQADVLVLLDNVQFKKRYFENRNRIRSSNGPVWLTVPVLTRGRSTQTIRQVEIDPTADWAPGQWKAIRLSYARAPHFERYASFLDEIYLGRSWRRLSELNETFIRWGLERFGYRPKVLRASELGIQERASALLASICEEVGADCYLSGISGKDYLDESEFSRRGVCVRYQEFHHPVYEQIHGEFEPCMSFLDLLFNEGPRAAEIMAGGGRRLAQVFT